MAMLRKFITIKKIGRFQNDGASGDTELKRYSLFFAENGRGKDDAVRHPPIPSVRRSCLRDRPYHSRKRGRA